ncbi:MAG: NUDIX domain-containing protein [bacterium]
MIVAVHAFLLRGTSVLLARRSNTGFEDGNYGAAGGHLEPRESITEAAVRECREEIGVEIDPADLEMIGVAHFRSPSGEGVDFFLRTRRWTGEASPRRECDDVRWCAVDALPENTIQFVRRAIERHLRAGQWFDEVDF